MATESGLTPKGEQLFYFIEELKGRGASQREALRAVRATGRSIGDKALRQVWRRLDEREEFARKIRFSKRGFKHDAEKAPITPVVGGLVRGRFEYRMEVSGVSNATGERVREYISITSNQVQDREFLESRARDLVIQADAGSAYSIRPQGLKVRLSAVSRRS